MKTLWRVVDILMFCIGVFVSTLWVVSKIDGGHFYLYAGRSQLQCTRVQDAPARDLGDMRWTEI